MGKLGDGRYEKSLCPQEPVLTPERKLWRAVLTLAYEEAEMPTDCGSPAEQAKARAYLRARSPFEAAELALVCSFAELPMDRLVSWARRRYDLAA
jgi:hypothetical protein